LLHLVGSSILLYLIDDARSNKNQVYHGLSHKATLFLYEGEYDNKKQE